MADISEKYANERQRIEEKYRTEATEEEIREAEREALMEQLEELRQLREERGWGIPSRREKEILQELEELKQQELAALEEAQAEETAAEEAAYQERQRLAELRREEELAAEVAAYEERKAERERQYQESLSDLEVSLGRERDERQRRYGEQLADLQASHAAELAEIEAANVERATQLDLRLADEKAKLDEAAGENKARLAAQLADEQANYAERQGELEAAYTTQKETIDDKLAEKTRAIETDLGEELVLWLNHWRDVDKGTYDGLRQMVEGSLSTWLDAAIIKLRQFRTDAENIMGPFDSPSRWMLDMGKGMEVGLQKGFDVTGLLSDYTKAFSQFRTSTEKVAQVAPTTYNQSSMRNVSNTKNVNLNVTAQYRNHQSEQSLRQDMEMYRMLMT